MNSSTEAKELYATIMCFCIHMKDIKKTDFATFLHLTRLLENLYFSKNTISDTEKELEKYYEWSHFKHSESYKSDITYTAVFEYYDGLYYNCSKGRIDINSDDELLREFNFIQSIKFE